MAASGLTTMAGGGAAGLEGLKGGALTAGATGEVVGGGLKIEIETEVAREALVKGAATAKGAAAGKGAAGAKGVIAGKGAAAGKGAGMAVKAAGGEPTLVTAGAKAAMTGGGVWTGKGLGLGLGLGGWGAIILGVLGAAAIYGYVKSRRAEKAQSNEEGELQEALNTTT